MPEVAYRDIYGEQSSTQGTFEIIKVLDANVREIGNDLYVFRRETDRNFETLDADVSSLKKDVTGLQQDTVVLKNDVSELKSENTQEELAEKMNVHSITISKWETGAQEPHSKRVAELARILGTSTAYLLGDTDRTLLYLKRKG